MSSCQWPELELIYVKTRNLTTSRFTKKPRWPCQPSSSALLTSFNWLVVASFLNSTCLHFLIWRARLWLWVWFLMRPPTLQTIWLLLLWRVAADESLPSNAELRGRKVLPGKPPCSPSRLKPRGSIIACTTHHLFLLYFQSHPSQTEPEADDKSWLFSSQKYTVFVVYT